MKIKFLETYQVKDAEGRIFYQGEVYDLPEPSARHFLKKGRAVIYAEEQKTEIGEEEEKWSEAGKEQEAEERTNETELTKKRRKQK